jgi:hypothetical protein
LTINKVVQNPNNIATTVPLDQLAFRINVGNNDQNEIVDISQATSPLTICINPGTFFVRETVSPLSAQTQYVTNVDGTITQTSGVSCFSTNVNQNQQITCTITNTLLSSTNTNIVSGVAPTTLGTEIAGSQNPAVSTIFALPSNITSTGSNTSTLSVLGTATENTTPDRITLSIGIETSNKIADAALMSNSVLTDKVLNVLRSVGVKENETSTSSFSISPNYLYQDGSRTNITRFTVTNSIKIESPNVSDVSKWIDASIKAGVNNINAIDFGLSVKKQEETRNLVMKHAIDDALSKARVAAQELGLHIIGVKSISLDPLERELLPLSQVGVAQGIGTDSTSNRIALPVLPGQQQVSEKVRLVFMAGP